MVADNSFKRYHRLLSPKQFQRVFDHPEKRVGSKQIQLLASPNELDYPRIGFVIGKKKIKLAVDRNLFRRITRESYRHKKAALKGWDIVIIAKHGAADMGNKQLLALLDNIWTRLLA